MPDGENPEIYLNNRTEGKAALNSVILRHTHRADGGKTASSLLVTSAQESDITNAISSSSC